MNPYLKNLSISTKKGEKKNMGKIIRNGVIYTGSSDEADKIHYKNSNSDLDSTTVQGALDELANEMLPKGGSCADVAYDNAVSGINATNIQEVLNAITSHGYTNNILINSNFANPVNQRAKTTLGADIRTVHEDYWIDRWIAHKATGIICNISDGFIHFERSTDSAYASTSGELYFKQLVENGKSYVGKTLTISLKYRTNSTAAFIQGHIMHQNLTVDAIYQKTTDLLIADGAWHIATHTFTVPSMASTDQLCPLLIGFLNAPAGAYLDVEWAKVEYGNFATPYIPRLYAEEMNLCLRYYRTIDLCNTRNAGIVGRKIDFYRPLDFTMRELITNVKVDVLSLVGVGYSSFDGSDTGLLDSGTFEYVTGQNVMHVTYVHDIDLPAEFLTGCYVSLSGRVSIDSEIR